MADHYTYVSLKVLIFMNMKIRKIKKKNTFLNIKKLYL